MEKPYVGNCPTCNADSYSNRARRSSGGNTTCIKGHTTATDNGYSTKATTAVKIEAATRLAAATEDLLQALDPVGDSLNYALASLNKAKPKLSAYNKQVMTLSQSIKDAMTELKVLQEEIA